MLQLVSSIPERRRQVSDRISFGNTQGRQTAATKKLPIILEYQRMIEGQWRRQSSHAKQFRSSGIVLRLRCTARLGKVYRTHSMSARIALRRGITTQQRFQRHVQTRFFQGLTRQNYL